MRAGPARRTLEACPKAFRTARSTRTSWCTPALDGSRRVTADGETLGTAGHEDDVAEILRLADLYVTDVADDDLVEWQGGGPDDWPGLSAPHEQ